MQRPKLCSEQSLFKQSLTGNLAPLTHSDSTLLRKKKEEQEPALGRVSRQELAPRRRPAEHNGLCPELPTAPKPGGSLVPPAWLKKKGPAFSALPVGLPYHTAILSPPSLPLFPSPPCPGVPWGLFPLLLLLLSWRCCPSGCREGPTGPQGFQAAEASTAGGQAGGREGLTLPVPALSI